VDAIDTEYASYRTGHYDYSDVPGNDAASAQSQPGFNEVPLLQINYFGMNFDLPPFDNLQVRQAFDLALNKQLLVDSILHGTAIPTNHIVPRGMPGFDTDLRIPDGDTATDGSQAVTGNQTKAIALLKQVTDGCTADPTKDWCPYVANKTQSSPIQVWYPAGSTARQLTTQAAVTAWNQILGLNVQAKVEGDANTYFGNLYPNGPYQAWNVGWLADYPDPQDWLSLQFHSNTISNASDVRISSLDALMTQADGEQNTTTRMADYNTIEQQAVWQSPWIPYDQPEALWLQRPWVHGFGLNSLLLMPDINWPSVYIAAHGS
jgi:oligopeptide transport system substrate-binding protein